MNKSFYNTIGASMAQLDLFEAHASTQEARVLEFFRERSHEAFTPFDVQKAVFYANTPITSVRRAITNLTKAGKLFKTSDQKDGNYGTKNHKWQLVPQVSYEERG